MEEENVELLEQLRIEEFIWVVYLVVIGLSYYANTIERNYIYTGNEESKRKYRQINIIVFTIVTLICIYFTYENYKELQELNESDSEEKKQLVYIEFIGSVLALGAALCFLYAVIKDVNIETELAFG